MSEYSSGVLFLNQHLSIMQDAGKTLREPYYLRQLNNKWSGFFPAATELESSDSPWLLELSKRLPLLLLEITDDHGWGYEVIHDGQVKAELWVNYELEWNMADAVAAKRYPQYAGNTIDAVITHSIPFDTIVLEVVESAAYRQAVEAQYGNVNLPALKVFEIPPEAIAELSAVLTADWQLNQDMFSQVDIFKEQMRLTGFDWMSYHYLVRRGILPVGYEE